MGKSASLYPGETERATHGRVDILPTTNKRERFRLIYPTDDRPKIDVAGFTCPVLDVSEFGVKFSFPKDFRTFLKQKLGATITFRDKKVFEIEGSVVRVDADRGLCAMRLTVGLPMPRIMEEERYLILKLKKRR